MHITQFFQNAVLHWPLQADHEKTDLTQALGVTEKTLLLQDRQKIKFFWLVG